MRCLQGVLWISPAFPIAAGASRGIRECQHRKEHPPSSMGGKMVLRNGLQQVCLSLLSTPYLMDQSADPGV